MHLEAWNFAHSFPNFCLWIFFLISKIIYTLFRNRRCPPRLLWGRSGYAVRISSSTVCRDIKFVQSFLKGPYHDELSFYMLKYWFCWVQRHICGPNWIFDSPTGTQKWLSGTISGTQNRLSKLLFRIAHFACHLLFLIAIFTCHLLFRIATFACLTSARNFSFCLIVGLSKIQLGQQICLWTQQNQYFNI